MGNPVAVNTWTVRFIMPLFQGGAIAVPGYLAARAVATALNSSDPNNAGAVVGLTLLTGSLFKLYLFPAPTVKQQRKGESNSTWLSRFIGGLFNSKPLPRRLQTVDYAGAVPNYIELANKTFTDPVGATGEVKPQDRDGWPVDGDRLRVWCFQIAYHSAPLGADYWTNNSHKKGSPEWKIFLKGEYKELIERTIERGMVCRKNPNNVHSPAFLTEKGYAWCRNVVVKHDPLSREGYTTPQYMTKFCRAMQAGRRADALDGAGEAA